MNILWDFDGTLFDTYPAYARIFSKVLGGNETEVEIYKKLKVSLSHAIDHYTLSKEQIDEMDRLKEKLQPEDMLPFESVEEVLKLADKNVIMTHKDRKGVNAILQYYGWENYFSDMVTIDDGFPRKPDTASYRYLHEKYGIDLVIGDREIDLIPAKELGIKTCIFQGESKFADYSLTNYDEFQDTLDLNSLKKENS